MACGSPLALLPCLQMREAGFLKQVKTEFLRSDGRDRGEKSLILGDITPMGSNPSPKMMASLSGLLIFIPYSYKAISPITLLLTTHRPRIRRLLPNQELLLTLFIQTEQPKLLTETRTDLFVLSNS